MIDALTLHDAVCSLQTVSAELVHRAAGMRSEPTTTEALLCRRVLVIAVDFRVVFIVGILTPRGVERRAEGAVHVFEPDDAPDGVVRDDRCDADGRQVVVGLERMRCGEVAPDQDVVD